MSDLQHGDDYGQADDGPIYDERRPRRLSPLTRMLVIAAIVVAVGAFGVLVWFAYNEGVRSGAEDAAPVLRADADPVKRKPEDAGGMAIPHQDKLVYNRIAPGQAQQPVERLLPPPEAPVDRPQPLADPPAEPAAEASPPVPSATLPTTPPTTSSGDSIAQAIVEAGKDIEPAGATPFVRTPDASTTAPEPPPAPAVSPEPAPQQAAVPPPPAATTAGPPAWRIQLASLTSEGAARGEWQRMQKANDDLLGKLQLSVQTANLEKGTYHRIQAGPLADRAAASALCSALKARKQDCLIVAP